MAKTLLFYTGVYSFTVEEFINKLSEIDENEDLIIKLNSPGGSVFAGWSMAQAIAERPGKTTIITEGLAASMSFILPLFADDVQTLDVTNWMIHRATAYIENEDDQKLLDKINEDLKKRVKARIDEKAFKEITGVTINDIFDKNKERRSIWLTAQEAKKVGLVSKVIKLQPKQLKVSAEKFIAFYDEFGSAEHKEEKPKENNKPQNSKIMTIEEFKSANPEAYNSILEKGRQEERDRVLALLAYNEIDSKAVVEAVKSGNPITESFRSEMAVKQLAKIKLDKAKEESPEDVDDKTDPKDEDPKKNEVEKEIEDFKKGVFADLGIKTNQN